MSEPHHSNPTNGVRPSVLDSEYSCDSADSIDATYRGSVNGTFSISDRAAFWHDAIGDSARVLNQGGLSVSYVCSVHVYCDCCKKTGEYYRTGGNVSCTYTYNLTDRFANPTDRGGNIYADNYEQRRACIKRCYQNHTIWERFKSDWVRTDFTKCLEACDKQYPETEILWGKPYGIVATWQEKSEFYLEAQSCQ